MKSRNGTTEANPLRLIAQGLKRPVLPATLVLAFLCALDMAYTVAVVKAGIAVESNPLLAPLFEKSTLAFIVVKSLSFMIPLSLIESIRPLCPEFTQRSMKIAAAGYLLVYIVGSLHIHKLL